MGNLSFSISTEGLREKGDVFYKEAKVIEEALEDIKNARSDLAGWVSSNKAPFEQKIDDAMPTLKEMVEVVKSYGGVAIQTSARIVDVENKIAAKIENSDIGA